MSEPCYVVVQGARVGVIWPARGGGFTLRTGASLIRPRVHHFSLDEGLQGVVAYVVKRFGAEPEFVPAAGSLPDA